METNENAGFEASIHKTCEKTELLKRRVQGDAIHAVSRYPLSPLQVENVEFPMTLVKFTNGDSRTASKRFGDLEQELEKALNQNLEMRRTIEELERVQKVNESAVNAGHTVMIRFFLEYIYGAVTHGKNKKISLAMQEADGPFLSIRHTAEADSLPTVLDVTKHAETLKGLDRMKGNLSNHGCHSGSISGIAAALQLQRQVHDLLSPEELERLTSLFEDLFGISVDEAVRKFESPIYNRKLETQSRQEQANKRRSKLREQVSA